MGGDGSISRKRDSRTPYVLGSSAAQGRTTSRNKRGAALGQRVYSIVLHTSAKIYLV